MTGPAHGDPAAVPGARTPHGPRPAVFDPGLQPERTALAWRRTALSLVVVSLAAARLLPPALGPGAVALALAGIGVGVAVHVLALRRSRRQTSRLLREGDLDDTGVAGGLLALTAGACTVLGVGGLVLVLVHGSPGTGGA
ncbi:DUF202 domain-containing protein [Kineococcus sp. G2]|uniref:DUF202 domain-containing protein n=1 Tax=Kineococcus sp. G2 TaxID=3127484 RepID=UPI00301D9070